MTITELKKPLLTQKQESFCLNILQGMSQIDAYKKAGYSMNMSPAVLNVKASQLRANGNVSVRIDELRKEVKDPTIADVQERQRILTEIARGNLIDYQEVGADGGYLSIGKESPNTRAISEITSRTEYDSKGSGAAVVTKVKLHSPTQAIDILNKMDRVYSDTQVNQNTTNIMNIIVMDGQTKDLIAQVKERTSKLLEAPNP